MKKSTGISVAEECVCASRTESAMQGELRSTCTTFQEYLPSGSAGPTVGGFKSVSNEKTHLDGIASSRSVPTLVQQSVVLAPSLNNAGRPNTVATPLPTPSVSPIIPMSRPPYARSVTVTPSSTERHRIRCPRSVGRHVCRYQSNRSKDLGVISGWMEQQNQTKRDLERRALKNASPYHPSHLARIPRKTSNEWSSA